jgi:hypothetical protein
MSAKIAFNGLDPERTALVVVHMVKGVAGEVVTPFSRLFRQRAEQTGIIKTQLRLLDGFRSRIPSGLPTILKVDDDKCVYEDSTHLLSLAKGR